MFKPVFTIEELAKITNGELLGNIDNTLSLSLSTDTRTITATDTYIAICGKVFDGHNFIKDAFDKGAKIAIIDKNHADIAKNISMPVLIVENTTAAYLSLASFHKNRQKVKVIAVTGSAGKTTTKEILHSIFNSKYKTQKSIKNHNNEIGLCQTLLSIEPDTKYCIVKWE